jgi:NAD-dependent dihydropyrimidine dehydrogenase PreA subunit
MTKLKRIPEFMWGKKFPKISVDLTKCTIPFQCKKCLQVCPECCFTVSRDMSKEKRLEEMDPRVDGAFVLYVARRDKCVICNKCIDVCPVDAITIEEPEFQEFNALKRDKKWEDA